MKLPSFLHACIGVAVLLAGAGLCVDAIQRARAESAAADAAKALTLSIQGAGKTLPLADRVLARVDDQVGALRVDLFAEIAASRAELLTKADAQLTALRGDVMLQVTGFRSVADARLGDAMARYDATLKVLDTRTGEVTAAVSGVRTDLKPMLANTASLVKDAQDSWDDSYDDVRSLLDSAEVATTQSAQTLQTVNGATAAFLAQAQETNKHLAGITDDVHDATHNLDIKYFHPPPRTFKQKLVAFFSDFEALLIAALRGGVI